MDEDERWREGRDWVPLRCLRRRRGRKATASKGWDSRNETNGPGGGAEFIFFENYISILRVSFIMLGYKT